MNCFRIKSFSPLQKKKNKKNANFEGGQTRRVGLIEEGCDRSVGVRVLEPIQIVLLTAPPKISEPVMRTLLWAWLEMQMDWIACQPIPSLLGTWQSPSLWDGAWDICTSLSCTLASMVLVSFPNFSLHFSSREQPLICFGPTQILGSPAQRLLPSW